jgi:hypothetical protein
VESINKRRTGILLLSLSFLSWAGVALVPFLDVGATQKWALGAFLYILSWGLFAMSVAVMGKEAYTRMKDSLIRKIRKLRT